MRDAAVRVWQWRQSPNARLRRAWWAGLFAILLLFLLSPAARGLLSIWVATNLLLSVTASAWALLHPRRLRPAVSLALRWSTWLAIGGGLWLAMAATNHLQQLNESEFSGAPIPTVTVSHLIHISFFFALPIASLLLLPVALCGSFAAAAIAAWSGRHRGDTGSLNPDLVAGIPVWWLAALSGMILTLAPIGAGRWWLLASVPALTFCWGRLRHPEALIASLRKAYSRSTRALVIHPTAGRGVLDLRGPALGLGTACLVLAIAATGALSFVQTTALVWMMQSRNNVMPLAWMNGRDDARAAASRTRQSPFSSEARDLDRIVILTMDPEVVHEALVDGSEAGVQAQVIRRVKRWHPRAILLPMPRLDPEDIPSWTPARDTPTIRPVDISRSIRDLPLLANAIRNVPSLLLEAAGSDLDRARRLVHSPEARLLRTAPAIARVDLEPFQADDLWTIPAPSAASAAGPGSPLSLALAARTGSDFALAGRRSWLVTPVRPGQILVDFLSIDPNRDCVNLSYSSILRDEPIHPVSSFATADSSGWILPSRYLENRIILLEPIYPHSWDTPAGAVSDSERLGYTIATVLEGQALSRLAGAPSALLILLLGFVVGASSAGRNPGSSSWRAALLLGLIASGSLVAFVFARTWIDPVAPALVVVGSTLLVGQLTFALERSERERTRSLLGRFVSPQVLDELLEDPESLALGGRRQQVCVLFADVRGFTPFTERHSPEEVIETTNGYLTVMTHALFDHRGVLDKYTGDGLMAFFPVASKRTDAAGDEMGARGEEVVRRSVAAAAAIQAAVADLSRRRMGAGQEPLGVGIGVHYGEAVVGLVGSPDRWDYTTLGHTVVVSQRLQTTARAGEIVISEDLFTAAGGQLAAEPRDPIAVKGIAEPVRSYRVIQKSDPSE